MHPALSWFEPGLFDPSLPTWVNNWDLFHAGLEYNFGLFNPVGEAKAKIETLVLDKGSHSATYFMEFNRLASHIQWGDDALLQQAYKAPVTVGLMDGNPTIAGTGHLNGFQQLLA